MKFLKVSTFYLEFVKFASDKLPGLPTLSYEEQLSYFFSFDFAWSDFWKRNIEASKEDISVTEIIFNIESLQKKWAEEQRVVYSQSNWQNEILEAQIEFHKPEVIFFEDYLRPPIEYRRKFPFIKFIACWDGIALKDPARYIGANVIASCHQGTVDFYRSKKINAYHFIFGFETTLLEKIRKRPPTYDISFVGSITISKNGHKQRVQLFDALNRSLPVNYWIGGADNTSILSMQMLKNVIKGRLPEVLKLNKILKHNKGQAFGLDMYQILSDSKITINSHIDAAGPYAANMRLFESTGVGVCLLTDWKKNLNDLFELDKEVVAFKSKEECVEKAKWLLDHETERAAIAAAGQKRVVEQYSLKKRILDFIETIQY